MPKELNKKDFESEVVNGKGVALVDFWAAWCPPCRALAPILEQVQDEVGDKATVYKVDVEANNDLAVEHGITSLPTVKLFKDGEEIGGWAGLVPKSVYIEAIEANQ